MQSTLGESETGASEGDNTGVPYVTYRKRWAVLCAFALLNCSNALLWVTFSTISDVAQTYFRCTATKVNTLATIFLVLYPLGTILEVIFFKAFGLRQTLLLGGILTTVGAALRLAIATNKAVVSADVLYGVTLLGQALAALAQPMFVNFPAHLSNAWFPVHERDLSTTVGTLFSPIGNAVGQFLPVLLVSVDAAQNVSGMASLMLVEFLVCSASLALGFFIVADSPPTPPSKSSEALESRTTTPRLFKDDGDIYSPLAQGQDSSYLSDLLFDCATLLRDKNYVVLWFAFSLALGMFNSLLTLVNQVVEPWGYSNDEASYCGMALIVAGLIGAGICSVIMERTKAYMTIVRWGFFACLISAVFLVSMLRRANLVGLLIGWALLGFWLLPMLPASFELVAEFTYPITSDISVGLLLVGGNVVGIPLVYALESLIRTMAWDATPGSSIFVVATIFVASSLLFLMCPTYKRQLAEAGDSAACLNRPLMGEK